ncbi:MAG TPA: MFS transporter [Microlunatus sp.]|nr:MFS transporter [Microlunatus sp.]
MVWILATFGVGMTLGMIIGGWLVDRALMPTLYLGLLSLAVILAVFGFVVTRPVGAFVGVFVVGAVSTLLMPALQTRLMDVAQEGQSLAAALNHAVPNIGNAVGALLGGLVLAAGLSYAWPSRAAVALPLLGLGVLALGRRIERRSRT